MNKTKTSTENATLFYKVELDLIRVDKVIKTVGVNAWAVYSVLKSFINLESQLSFPSYTKLQELTGMGRSTISKALQVLEEHGLIQKVSTGSKGGSNNEYKVNNRTRHSYNAANTNVRKMNRGKAEEDDSQRSETALSPVPVEQPKRELSSLEEKLKAREHVLGHETAEGITAKEVYKLAVNKRYTKFLDKYEGPKNLDDDLYFLSRFDKSEGNEILEQIWNEVQAA